MHRLFWSIATFKGKSSVIACNIKHPGWTAEILPIGSGVWCHDDKHQSLDVNNLTHDISTK